MEEVEQVDVCCLFDLFDEGALDVLKVLLVLLVLHGRSPFTGANICFTFLDYQNYSKKAIQLLIY